MKFKNNKEVVTSINSYKEILKVIEEGLKKAGDVPVNGFIFSINTDKYNLSILGGDEASIYVATEQLFRKLRENCKTDDFMLNTLMRLSKIKTMYSEEYMQELTKILEENLENPKEDLENAKKSMEEIKNEKN